MTRLENIACDAGEGSYGNTVLVAPEASIDTDGLKLRPQCQSRTSISSD